MTFCVTACMAAPATAKPPPAASASSTRGRRSSHTMLIAERLSSSFSIPNSFSLTTSITVANIQIRRAEQDAARDAENHRRQQTQKHQPEHPPGPFLHLNFLFLHIHHPSAF